MAAELKTKTNTNTSTNTVTSRDGTVIAYDRAGSGPVRGEEAGATAGVPVHGDQL